ncbi:hypothetical protein D3C78_1699150 [compost metagenome]
MYIGTMGATNFIGAAAVFGDKQFDHFVMVRTRPLCGAQQYCQIAHDHVGMLLKE